MINYNNCFYVGVKIKYKILNNNKTKYIIIIKIFVSIIQKIFN